MKFTEVLCEYLESHDLWFVENHQFSRRQIIIATKKQKTARRSLLSQPSAELGAICIANELGWAIMASDRVSWLMRLLRVDILNYKEFIRRLSESCEKLLEIL